MPLSTWRSHLTWRMHDVHVWITCVLVTLNCLDTEVLQMTTGNVTDRCNYLRTVKPALRNHSKSQPKDQSLSAGWALADTQKGISHSMEPVSRHFSILEVFRVIFSVGFGVSVSSVESPHFSSVKVFQSSANIFHFQVLIFSRKVKYYVENKYSNETCHYSKTSVFC